MKKITEQPSLYNDLEKKSVEELTSGLITEYKKIAPAVEAAKPQLDRLLTAVVEKVKAGGRMIYLGIAEVSDYPVEVITGPEFVTGSTRMKAGTSQKMVFDMISTTVMIQLGRVLDNRMVNVKLINRKITDRAVRILMDKSGIKDYEQARAFLFEQGSVARALKVLHQIGEMKQ